VVDAFALADNMHEESWSSDNWNEPCFVDLRVEEVPKDGNNAKDGDSAKFDPHTLEDAVHGLYTRAKSSKLATTILLLNLCIIHGVGNSFCS
jgi:hypothetical protein